MKSCKGQVNQAKSERERWCIAEFLVWLLRQKDVVFPKRLWMCGKGCDYVEKNKAMIFRKQKHRLFGLLHLFEIYLCHYEIATKNQPWSHAHHSQVTLPVSTQNSTIISNPIEATRSRFPSFENCNVCKCYTIA